MHNRKREGGAPVVGSVRRQKVEGFKLAEGMGKRVHHGRERRGGSKSTACLSSPRAWQRPIAGRRTERKPRIEGDNLWTVRKRAVLLAARLVGPLGWRWREPHPLGGPGRGASGSNRPSRSVSCHPSGFGPDLCEDDPPLAVMGAGSPSLLQGEAHPPRPRLLVHKECTPSVLLVR